ncbi:MAG: hypothetical protein JSS11_10060 [Verrucomicrobia bacterium]|nr:hypothetical protein [Verrucomicrobiota bacterium]
MILLALARGSAQTAIPEAESLQVPTPARLAQIAADATRTGWAAQKDTLHQAAKSAYDRDRLAAAEAWLNAYKWSVIFAMNEQEWTPRWIRTVEQAGVNHANMPRTYQVRSQPLAAELAPETQAWLFGHVDFSAKFFALLQPVDCLPQVLRILNRLYLWTPERFQAYPDLALAIAVVYDVPAPPDWPHAQVTAASLPRGWPTPTTAFDWWVRQDQAGRTYFRLNRLPADELKFVVDATASFDDLEWTQVMVDYPLSLLGRAYAMIAYRTERIAHNQPVWVNGPYTLPSILGTGGICVDQAYFACQVGKARGVPTLHFSGVGNDGRHAWFGYLGPDQKWVFDVGRYAEQRYVTGFARDPQTWGRLSDHELAFLSEGFRRLPSYEQSRAHAAFAADFLLRGEYEAAAKAARKAAGFEPRNVAAWETLLSAEKALNLPPKQREGTLREAIRAFQRYPSLEAAYTNRLAASLRARGETSAAEVEENRIVRKNRGDRSDVSVEQARLNLVRIMQTRPLPEQVSAYNNLVDTLGRKGGTAFFDQVVVVFAEHLRQLDQRPEALRAIQRAQQKMEAAPDRQLGREFARLAEAMQAN